MNRRLVDQPVVLFDELSDDESEMARRNRRREAEGLTRLTGCDVELRREGMAVIDVTAQPLGARPFPTGGTEAHAALLWLVAMVDAVRPDPRRRRTATPMIRRRNCRARLPRSTTPGTPCSSATAAGSGGRHENDPPICGPPPPTSSCITV